MSTVSRARHRTPPGAARESGKKYAAFVSHSSDPDGKSVADSLRHGLHHLAKKWYRLRAMHVFLDTAAGMTVGAPLWEELRAALDASKFFVLIASPVAAERPWVDKEAAYWLEHNPPETLIIVAAQGEITWDDSRGDFDRPGTNALPSALYGKYREEPIFVDMREVRRPLDRKDPVLNDKIADVAACLRGVTKEELISQDRQEQRRNFRRAVGAIVVLVISLVLALAAGGIAVGERNDARAQARLALSRQLAAESRVLLSQSVDLAALLAVESYRINPDPQARSALLGVLSGNPGLERIRRFPLVRRSALPRWHEDHRPWIPGCFGLGCGERAATRPSLRGRHQGRRANRRGTLPADVRSRSQSQRPQARRLYARQDHRAVGSCPASATRYQRGSSRSRGRSRCRNIRLGTAATGVQPGRTIHPLDRLGRSIYIRRQ